MNSIHHSSCPVCGSGSIDPLLTVRDHSVSGEEFVVWQCGECSLRFTQDAPAQEAIGPYYASGDYISHSNTSRGLVNRMYQRVRKHTLKQKARLIEAQTRQRGRLLDMGAGVGAFLHTMQERGWEVKGIEPDPGARAVAQAQFRIQLEDTSTLNALRPGHFDAITLWHVLEHVHALHPYVERMKEALKPDGKIFIAVPNYQSADSSIYKLYWAAYDVPRHLYHFSPRSMQVLMERHGLKIRAKKPMWFDSFYISLLSSRYKNGKTRWIGAGLAGLRSNLSALLNRDKASSVLYIIEKDQRSN